MENNFTCVLKDSVGAKFVSAYILGTYFTNDVKWLLKKNREFFQKNP
jgi:hypothetical protein